MKEQNDVPNECQDKSSRPSAITRRDFLKAPAAVAATSVALPSVFGNVFMVDATKADAGLTILAPRYYPLEVFTPEIGLQGKLAVITGASRGIGRATAEALLALGAEVIGTSRDVAHVPNPPAYPLLDLDITKPKSVKRFVSALTDAVHGKKVDILINNAGRHVIGSIIPLPPNTLDFYLAQNQLGIDTVYRGHVRMTNAIMPLMATQGYARILFTVSIAAYTVGGSESVSSFQHGYTSGKRALLAYANGLRAILREASSNIRVSTVNPYFISTVIAEHPNPIYTEPVLDNGFTDDPPTQTPFNQFLTFYRQTLSVALPPSFVGLTYAQLLRTEEPPANVVVASTKEPFATQGGTALIEPIVLAENAESAPRFSCN